jgi:PAS domain S-box-containing protein
VTQWLGAAVDVDAQRTAAEYLREMMEAVPQIVYTSGPDSGVDYYNRHWYDLTGQTEEDAAGKGWINVIHPDDLPPLVEIVSSSKLAGRPYRAEYRIRRKADGTYRWHTVSARPVTDSAGTIVKWVGIATDIEDQKRREAAMRFVADASELLTSSFDVERRLQSVAYRVVPEIADWCGIYLKRDSGLEPIAIAHRDPAMVDFLFRVMNRYPSRENESMKALLSGKPVVVPVVHDEMLVAAAQDMTHLEMIRKLDVRSSIQMPIVGRGRVLGSIHVVNGASGRIFDDEDVQLIEILAKRAAVAIDNARIYERCPKCAASRSRRSTIRLKAKRKSAAIGTMRS